MLGLTSSLRRMALSLLERCYAEDDPPPTHLNKEIMDMYRPLLEQYYYDETRFETYLEQLGIVYPTLTRPISEENEPGGGR